MPHLFQVKLTKPLTKKFFFDKDGASKEACPDRKKAYVLRLFIIPSLPFSSVVSAPSVLRFVGISDVVVGKQVGGGLVLL